MSWTARFRSAAAAFWASVRMFDFATSASRRASAISSLISSCTLAMRAECSARVCSLLRRAVSASAMSLRMRSSRLSSPSASGFQASHVSATRNSTNVISVHRARSVLHEIGSAS